MKKENNHLCRCGLERRPIKAGQDVDEELRVDVDLVLRELGVFWVQREGRRRGLAGLDRAGQEIYAQDLHIDRI